MAEETTAAKGTRRVRFTIDGAMINGIALDKLWYENDFAGAVDVLMSATQPAEDVPYAKERQLATCLSILDGRSEIRGVYPGPDYGVYPVDEADEGHGKSLADWFASIRQRLADADRRVRTMQEKLQCVAEELSEAQMVEIDAAWRSEWCDPGDDDRTIFGTSAQAQIEYAMVNEFVQRMESDVDEPDYGWLFPDGTFHPVEWGEHQHWAWSWLMAHDPDFKEMTDPRSGNYVPIDRAGDYLSEHHRAILLHNPGLGTANATGVPGHRMTKAQKEYLYDYYTKRGLTDRADAIWRE